MPNSPLFVPFSFPTGQVLRNRVVMAPMTTWSGNADGTVSDDEIAWYMPRVQGAGLVVTGCTHVQANGVGFTHEFAAYDDRFLPSLRRLAETTKSGGAAAVLQIFHAGNKATPALIPGGEVVSASAVTTDPTAFAASVTPRALTDSEILEVIAAFGAATRRAIEAGFDGIELHGAHSFLLQNFLSPHYNRRTDRWGGSLENRMRFPLAVVAEVRRVIAEHSRKPFLLGYRVSPDEPDADGLRIGDVLALTDLLIDAGISYIHVSLSNVLLARPVGESEGPTLAAQFVQHVAGRIPVIAAGQVRTPEDASEALGTGLSLVAIGQGLVMNPDWVELAKAGQSDSIATALDTSKLEAIAVPGKLWTIIDTAKGWFKLAEPADVI